MNKLVAIVVVVGMLATFMTGPAFGQDTSEIAARKKSQVLRIKTAVKRDAATQPKHRMLIRFRDGTKIVGRIREVREDDFVVEISGKQLTRAIAYTELAKAPERYTPVAARIAEDAGLGVLLVILSPLILILGVTGAWD
jgi:hypothetical protein